MSGLAETSPNASRHRTREARTHVLPVAEVFSVLCAERNGTEVIAAVIVGDDRHPPKRHGLRATRARWAQLVQCLAEEDDGLREMLLAILSRNVVPFVAEGPVRPIRQAQGKIGEPILKPGGQLL